MIAKLVNITPITMVYDTDWVYRFLNQLITGAPHIVGISPTWEEFCATPGWMFTPRPFIKEGGYHLSFRFSRHFGEVSWQESIKHQTINQFYYPLLGEYTHLCLINHGLFIQPINETIKGTIFPFQGFSARPMKAQQGPTKRGPISEGIPPSLDV